MVKKLYSHQRAFLEKNPDKALLVWEVGTGKSLAACLWLNKRPQRKALIIAPKSIQEKWRKDLKENIVKADIITTDGIKKTDLSRYKAIVVDEAQNFASPLFIKGRSKRSTILYNYIRNNPDTHILLLSATPVRSSPWNIHTLACYMGIYWDVKSFKRKFFHLTNRYGRYFEEVNVGWQKEIRQFVEKISDIVLMSDCVDVPVQEERVIRITTPKMPKPTEFLNSTKLWYLEHKYEQGEIKMKTLQSLTDGYRKVIVVCHYLEQITAYEAELSKERMVYVLNGSTPDANQVIQDAQEADDCIFIIQASMGAGFDADSFSCVIFASLSFKYVDLVQMKGRVKRIHNLHRNMFIYLLAGRHDEQVYKTIMAHKDFDVHQNYE